MINSIRNITHDFFDSVKNIQIIFKVLYSIKNILNGKYQDQSLENRSLDDFLDTPYFSDQSTQIITISTDTADLPSKCTRCGAGTKQAGSRKRKKTKDIIYRVICTNKKCNASYSNIQDKTKMIGTTFDELVLGHSLREIVSIVNRKYSSKYSHVGLAGWLKKYQKLIKILTDDIACSLKFGNSWGVDETHVKLSNGQCWITAVLDEDSRFMIAYIVTEKRPNSKMIQILLSEAKITAGIPKVITSDLYIAYPKAIKKTFGEGIVEHRSIRSKTKKNTTFTVGPNHNNHIERSWRTIKRNALRNSSEWKWSEGIQHLIYYAMMHYNYIRIHSNFRTTPSVQAGYIKSFENFEEILKDASSYEKSFLFKLGDDIKFVNIRTPDHCNKIIISPKASADHKKTMNINRILEDCGFTRSRKNRGWIRKIQLIHTSTQSRNSSTVRLPARSFEICKKCNKIAVSLQEIDKQNGFRKMKDGIIRTQPRCRTCRHDKKSKKNVKNPILYSIMPIDTIASRGQSVLTYFPKHPTPKVLRSFREYVTVETSKNESYLQLTIHGRIPRQVLLTDYS